MTTKPMTFDEIFDIVEGAITDSLDFDWSPAHGARSVMRELRSHGLLRGQALPDAAMNELLDDAFRVALRRDLA